MRDHGTQKLTDTKRAHKDAEYVRIARSLDGSKTPHEQSIRSFRLYPRGFGGRIVRVNLGGSGEVASKPSTNQTHMTGGMR